MSAKLQFLSGGPLWNPTPQPSQLPALSDIMSGGYPIDMPKPGNTRGGTITGGDFGGMGGPQPAGASPAADCPDWYKFLIGGDDCHFDPLGAPVKAVTDTVGAVAGPLLTKIALIALGGLLLAIGVFALARGPSTQIVAGIKDGIREARG